MRTRWSPRAWTGAGNWCWAIWTPRPPCFPRARVKFRERMIAHDVDRKLLDRTVALAKATGQFGWQALRAALDSSPLVGRGRVEDTWNLLGRALRTVVTCAAKTL